MKKRNVSIIFFLFIVSCLSGCETLQQMELIDTPKVSFEGMSLSNISLFEATPIFRFKVKNPNPLGISVSKISYDLKINNKKFVNGVTDKYLRIDAAGSNVLELPVTFNYLDLFETVMDFVKTDSVAYDLTGSIAAGPFALPYQTDGKFNIPNLPKVSLNQVEISKLSLTGASLVFNLQIDNANQFDVNIKAFDYGIKLGGSQLASGIKNSVSRISKKSKSQISIPLNIDFASFSQALYRVLRNSSPDYELSGNMTFDIPKLGDRKFPFHKVGRVPLVR